jgi:hypothetical protein
MVDSGTVFHEGWCGAGCEPFHCYPNWYAAGDALFLHRSRARDTVITVDDNNTILDTADDIPLLTAGDLRFNDFEAGYRVEVGRAISHGLFVEASFFQVSEWDAAGQVTSNAMLSPLFEAEALSPPISFLLPNFDADPFFQALQHTVVYTSEILSGELNLKATWKRRSLERAELFGLRYVRIREHFNLLSQDEATSTFLNGFGSYDIETENDMFGLQYGQESTLPLHDLVSLHAKIRAGVYYNTMESHSRVISNALLVNDVGGREEDVAFVGEVNVNCKVKLSHWAAARAGYNLLWVEGVALAPEQDYPNALTGFAQLNDNGGMFLHGFNIGIELTR